MDIEDLKRNGRPHRELDQPTFEKLCYIQATREEMGHFFGCHIDTIDAWCHRTYGEGFSPTHKRFSAGGKISLRRKLIQQAEAGNMTALVFSLKNYVGMKDVWHVDQPTAPTANDDVKLQLIDDLREVYATLDQCKTALPTPKLVAPR